MEIRPNERDGFALPAAVFALVLLGMLVTGGFYVAHQEARVGVSSQHGSQALYVAERGVGDVISQGNVSDLTGLSLLADTTLTDTVADGAWEVTVTRMNPRTFFLDGTGRVIQGGEILGGAQRRIGVIAKLFSATIDPPAALTTQGSLRLGGSSQIVGTDTIPPGWTADCDPADMEDKPGVLIDDTDQISTSGNKLEVTGDPPVAEDPSLTIDKLLDFGDMDWEDLVQLASVEFPTSETVTNTAPDSSVVSGSYRCRPGQYNWGDPESAGAVCYNHFPIIYAAQDLHIASSAAGQGILLVEGDLTLQGGFEFYGPVIVRGTLSTAGTGGHINGGVIAANVDLDTSTVLGNALVQYSKCGVSRAVLNNSALTRIRPLADRSWVDLSNVAN